MHCATDFVFIELLQGISYITCGYTHLEFAAFRRENSLSLVQRLGMRFSLDVAQLNRIDMELQIFNTGCPLTS